MKFLYDFHDDVSPFGVVKGRDTLWYSIASETVYKMNDASGYLDVTECTELYVLLRNPTAHRRLVEEVSRGV